MRTLLRCLAGLGVLALAPVLGLATLAGTTSLTGDPAFFTVAGLAVFGAICLLGLLLCLPRPSRPLPRGLRALAVLGAAGLVVWKATAATLPPAAPAGPLPEVPGQREWVLPTGSRLAYLRHAPDAGPRPEPVIVLHGRPDLAGDSAVFGVLRRDRHVVYLYDRLGTGRSARLADPRGYGLERDVADLEAVRQAIGAPRVVLVGHSAGAQLAAAYIAKYPDRVVKAVFSSPTGLRTPPATAALSRLDARRLTVSALHPRSLVIETLARTDAAALRSFAGDAELDARQDAWNRLAWPTLHCPGATVRVAPGAGGLATLLRRPTPGWVASGLARTPVPALIIRGACDPLTAAADEYRAALPHATVAELPRAGHDSYRDQREPYLKVLRAFLDR
ncbi:alpha/beta fold hydrolase [Thermoactinospora rubra]|uniref:alpha/beta fold hydrolase n=1 Tax=Thermoactinospora rubra TaxID=1088767 RepID=UPI000A11A1F0|nr:alpha/beta fold hydrolase [Thermoactinospora rubra]